MLRDRVFVSAGRYEGGTASREASRSDMIRRINKVND